MAAVGAKRLGPGGGLWGGGLWGGVGGLREVQDTNVSGALCGSTAP